MIDGNQHREDGPAVESIHHVKWFLHGKEHRTDGPAVEYQDGTKEWWINGLKHRIGAPAVEHSDGSTEWWQNGMKHREDGPAVEYAGQDIKEWYLKDRELSEADYKVAVSMLNAVRAEQSLMLVSSMLRGTPAPVKAPSIAKFRK